jgi:copper chaperone CopZ
MYFKKIKQMKLLKNIIAICLLSSSLYGYGQNTAMTTQTVKVSGNCGMCKKTIEKAGNSADSKVDWNEDNQTAKVSFNAEKTSLDAVLKNIALAGYDNEKYLAPATTYAELHGCCQYDRTLSAPPANPENKEESIENSSVAKAGNFQPIYDQYFILKDALIAADHQAVTAGAAKLSNLLSTLKSTSLTTTEQQVWKTQANSLAQHSKALQDAKDLAKQRLVFVSLSEEVYKLAKSSKPALPVYQQKCPMFNGGKGATWLSLIKEVKNPYYGAQMLTCGSTIQTIQ